MVKYIVGGGGGGSPWRIERGGEVKIEKIKLK